MAKEKIHTILRDMPKELAAAVRERIVTLRTKEGLMAPEIALRIKAEFVHIDVPSETVRSVLRTNNSQPPATEVYHKDVPDERQKIPL